MMTATRHPPIQQKYAAYTNQGFLLREIGIVAGLLLQGVSNDDLRQRVEQDDLFQLPSKSSRKTILGAVQQRLSNVPDSLLILLAEGSLDLRRLTNLYLILLKHRLLRDFIAEVVLEELRRFSRMLPPSEVGAFTHRKHDQVPDIAGWSEATLNKSRSNIITICLQAGLLSEAPDGFAIQPQVVPQTLRDELIQAGRQAFLPLLLDRETV